MLESCSSPSPTSLAVVYLQPVKAVTLILSSHPPSLEPARVLIKSDRTCLRAPTITSIYCNFIQPPIIKESSM